MKVEAYQCDSCGRIPTVNDGFIFSGGVRTLDDKVLISNIPDNEVHYCKLCAAKKLGLSVIDKRETFENGGYR